MNTDVSELVREGLDRLTAGATPPPGLAAAALRQHRRRRRTNTVIISAVATAAATTAAAVALVGTSAAPGVSSPNRVNLTAFIISQTKRALARPGSEAVVRAAVSQPGVSIVSWSDQGGSKTELTASTTGARQAGVYVVRHGGVTVVTGCKADTPRRSPKDRGASVA